MEKIISLDLFSGIGGFTKGLLEAGVPIEKHYFSEVDKHAIANYSYNFRNAIYVGSVTNVRHIIRTINAARTGKRLVITFGSPCQDFSLAGKRNGLAGSRSSLIKYAIVLIRWLRPDVFIWENVKGAYSSNAGADYWAIMQAFANLDGYRCEGQLLNTAWFLPQNRERIYVVGHLAGRSECGIFPFTENIGRAYEREGEATVSRTFMCGTNGGLNSHNTLIKTITAGGHSGGMHSSMALIKCINGTASQDARIYETDGISPTLQSVSENSGYCVPKIKVVGNIYPSSHEAGNIYSKDGISPTIKCNGPRPNMKNIAPKIETGGIRRLTEIECERLQGFPDDWTKHGLYDGVLKKVSRTGRYKMCGNAVSVPVVKAIGERIKLIA